MKKVLAFLLTAVMLFSLTACSLPKNSKDLFVIYSVMKKVNSFHVTGEADGNVSVRMLGLSVDVPFTVDAESDINGGQSHSTADVSLSYFEKPLDVTVEAYTISDGTVYAKETVYGSEEENIPWVCFPRKETQSSASSQSSFSPEDLLTDELFDSMEYIHNKESGTLTVVVPLSGITENPAFQAKLDELFTSEKTSSLPPLNPETRQVLLDELGKCSLTCIFDNTHHLCSVSLSEFSCELKSGGKLLSRTVSVNCTLNLQFGSYNQVAGITLPDEVRNTAVSGDLSDSKLLSAIRAAVHKK